MASRLGGREPDKGVYLKLRMYQKESLVVIAVLVLPFFIVHQVRLTEVIAALAVFFTFQHAVIADRMQERQAILITPDVECYWKSNIYFLAKESMWIAFFFLTQSWAALLGAVVFFCYPLWRRFYRKRNPLLPSVLPTA